MIVSPANDHKSRRLKIAHSSRSRPRMVSQLMRALS
jgi:hypothetical protein